MAGLVEATSVIVRQQAIKDRYAGGWASFAKLVPNGTLCSDDQLARVGFMTPDDCKALLAAMVRAGIHCAPNGKSHDIVVADQLRGFTTRCDWAEFGKVDLKPRQNVSAARLKGSTVRKVFCPEGTTYRPTGTKASPVTP